jgi:hypothetical protein
MAYPASQRNRRSQSIFSDEFWERRAEQEWAHAQQRQRQAHEQQREFMRQVAERFTAELFAFYDRRAKRVLRGGRS